ncbi:pseudopodium-enriched atypical kinase 1 [Silurus asotus]|uniref:Pseudopodium-enriched atypical kinase 1 n=1 Tax=Silurus asotus TaxID=30991 RepID=A0AAD5FNQ9_SILAS|nr:pseudopodium-enriched atypical kinase 1 [Silurus asotus]
MSACNTFTEHVWKPGECKNCFKPKSLHCLPEGSPLKYPPEQVLSQHSHASPGGTNNINHPSPTGVRAITNANLASNPQRSSSSSRSGQFRPPVAKKPTIAVKPTMMLPCSGIGLDLEGNAQKLVEGAESGKASAFTIWNHNGFNRKRPTEPNNNERNDERVEMGGFASFCPPSSNNNSGLTDVLKEIAGLDSDLSSNRDDFLGRISCSYRRSLERGLPAASCLALGRSGSANKHVSLSNSAEIISSEGGRFCYPEFSVDGEEDEEYEEESESDDGEHESWDESDEELLAMEIRMRGQPRFANFRAATLSPVPFAAGKKWNTVPLRNRSLQRICAVDYDGYDDILNSYPSMDSSGAPSLLPYGSNPQGSGFLSNSESITSPESSSSLPEDSCTSSSGSSVSRNQPNGLHPIPFSRDSAVHQDPVGRAFSSPKATETHKAVLAIRLQDQDINQREGGPLPQALPGQPITISFSPTEEQPKPYRVVSLEKTPICKPYTVVDVSASMASTEEQTTESTAKPKCPSTSLGPPPYPGASKNIPLSASPFSPKSPVSIKTPLSPKSAAVSPTTPISPLNSVSQSVPVSLSTALANAATSSPSCKKPGNIRYQEVWTSSTSPRQKLPKVELLSGTPSGSSVPPRHVNHKSAPTSPVAGISSSRTIPVKSPNLSEIKFNSYNNAGMPPFPIIIRDEPTYARSSKNAVKVPIVINPSAYDNLAVYKSFLGVCGELPQAKPGTGGRVASHTYEEIGNSENAQASPTEHKLKKLVSADTTEERDTTRAGAHSDKGKNTPECSPSANISVTVSSPRTNIVPTLSTVSSSLTKSSSVKLNSSSNTGDDLPASGSSEGQISSSTGSGHREKASKVLSQIVASIQPPQSPPDSPSAHSKTCSFEELYSLPPDATKGTLSRPKSLHCPPDSSLSKSHTPSKLLPKSQSASAAEACTSPKSEPSAPFPPPRSTSSPYHASNLLQRHFSNWTRPTGSRPSDGDVSPGVEGRRSADGNRPKRWISFKSFFRRRKDEEEQKEKAEKEKEKEKGKLVGLDGTVITMLPPPPLQRQHWFSESKTDDPNQKPTIIFTYKPDSGAGGDGEAELRVEECNAGATGVLSYNQPGPPKSRASLLISKVMSQMPVQGPETDPTAIASLPAKQKLPTVNEPPGLSTHPVPRPLSPNISQSRASLIPAKHPRHPKSADDTLHSESEGFNMGPKSTPPPLPKKNVPRANTEPSMTRDPMNRRPLGEAKPGGASLSVANPLYDLDSTWDTASQSSSLSSDARQLDESGDSLERPVAGGSSHSRSANSSTALDREKLGCRSTESLTAGKSHRLALYRGLDSWEEVAGRIRSLHADTLRKLAGRCEDRFMAGQKDHLRFGTDSWSHFRLTTGKPCCEAEDAVYYTASYAKDPLINYAVKICRYKVKETQQQFFHSLAVRQSLSVHFNIQQDCGHFLADVPARLLPWENEESSEDERDEKREEERTLEQKSGGSKELLSEWKRHAVRGHGNLAVSEDLASHSGKLRSRVVVITREVPFQTVADFVQDGASRHSRNPELYERQVCLLLLQLCSGLEHMKPYHVSHCDLHLKNLLLVHCQPGDPCNLEPPEPNNNTTSASSACPARLIISNFSQAKQQSIVQYTEGDEFQLGLLIYEMLHQPNPLVEAPGPKKREQLPPLPTRSLYSQGLQRLAGLLLHTDESERVGVAEARACLQCLLWGPRDDLLRNTPLPIQRHAALQNWLDLKRTLMMIKFAERSLDAGHSARGVSLEDWLCCKYLAFATTESIDRVVRVLQQL